MYFRISIKLCMDLGLLGSLRYGPCKQESKNKNTFFKIFNMQIRTFVKKNYQCNKKQHFSNNTLMNIKRSGSMGRLQNCKPN